MSDPDLNPYASSTTSELTLEQRLLSEQSLTGTILGSLAGAIPGLLIYFLLIPYPLFSFTVYFLPGLLIGFFAGFMGRGIDKIHRVVSASITLLCISIVSWLLDLPSAAIGLSFINCIIAALISVRRLTREEADALFNYKIGYQTKK
ncbi:hypothetical protein [Pleionea sediminis]|uniref:hypothetical protein n=1 Tax=Pleionea sediminis TaxID=2569479 RepID=UPI001185C828|nr:hypothetical protein [Pleionea sediminis]